MFNLCPFNPNFNFAFYIQLCYYNYSTRTMASIIVRTEFFIELDS